MRPGGVARTSSTSTRRQKGPASTDRGTGTGSLIPKILPRHDEPAEPAPRVISRRWSVASGFTLIEIMVVRSLIVILATMGLVQYRQSIVRSKEAVLKED